MADETTEVAPALPNRGSGFAETEVLLAALAAGEGDALADDEVGARLGTMTPFELTGLIRACDDLAFRARDIRRVKRVATRQAEPEG